MKRIKDHVFQSEVKKCFFMVLAITAIFITLSFDVTAQDNRKLKALNQSEELGKVHWYRDYDQAVAVAKKEGKDVVILFQEVPGCSTCRNYGNNVLSHPLIVEALENSFVPLAIFNNKRGKDGEILRRFNEPAWNNPVVRIIDIERTDLVKRISNDYSAQTLCQRLIETLVKKNNHVPEYLNLLETELSSLKSSTISEEYFKMYCFWSGEKQLGKLEGVLDTEAGFVNHSEVVKVKYDTKMVDKTSLIDYAKSQNFTVLQDIQNYSVADNDVHYYLRNSKYKYLPLTALQKIKINSALGSRQSAEKYLSPRQKKWLKSLNKTAIVLYDKTFEMAWREKEAEENK